MPSFVTVTSGATAQAQDVNQLINAMNGTAGQGVPISLTAVNDSVNFALAVKNADPTNSRSLQVLRANNNVLIQADANGVIVSPDGGATTGQVMTVNATQTVTGKTFTTPHFTGPVVDSGGLTVALGGLTVSSGTSSLAGPLVIGTTTAGAGQIRLPNGINNGVYQRNAANTADLALLYDASDRLNLNTGATAIANAATAGANALPANPFGFLVVLIDGTIRKIPVYNN